MFALLGIEPFARCISQCFLLKISFTNRDNAAMKLPGSLELSCQSEYV